MTQAERKKLVKRVKLSILMIAIAVVCIGVRFVIAPIVSEGITAANNLTSLDTQVSNTLNQLSSLQYSIDSAGKVFVDLDENQDDYVKAIGLLCNANLLNIHKMTVGDVVAEEGGIATMNVELELQGDLSHVRSFINDVYDSEMVVRVNSFSYRLEGDAFSWMWRAIDDNDMVSWWDISNVTEYLLQDPELEADADDPAVLSAKAFMQHGTALCYLSIQVIGTGVDVP